MVSVVVRMNNMTEIEPGNGQPNLCPTLQLYDPVPMITESIARYKRRTAAGRYSMK
jgi:hypothetical protein|nr:hypothetical protein Q903MT_gene164 [Picea sitchensis]